MPIAIRKLFGLTLFVQILSLDSAPWARAEEIRVLYYPPVGPKVPVAVALAVLFSASIAEPRSSHR